MINKNLVLILLTNVVLGSAMPMLIILGGLAGAHLAPVPALITAAVSAQLLAGILVASPLSLFMGRVGRRSGFLLVAALTSTGALIAVLAMHHASFWLLCIAHLIMGAALVGVNFLRFAATEVVNESARPNALSFTLASGIVAALAGPSLFEYSQNLLSPVPFAGAYAAIAMLGLLGALPIAFMSLPAMATSSAVADSASLSLWQLLRSRPRIQLAIGVAAIAQGIMVLMMVPTPQAMVEHGYMHGHAADVIRWHVVAMFAPGLFTGILIKRFGVNPIIAVGLSFLLLAALVAVSGTGSGHFYVALVLLGIGWNFGFIGATHLLQMSLRAEEKARIQGLNDTVIAVSSVGASILSGVMYVGIGWIATSFTIIPVLLVAMAWLLVTSRRLAVG